MTRHILSPSFLVAALLFATPAHAQDRMTLRFLRDDAGKVVAVDFSRPVFRSVQFTRVGDRTSPR